MLSVQLAFCACMTWGSPPYVRYRSNSALSFAVDCKCISVFRERQWQHLKLDISSSEMDDFAIIAELSISLDDFAEWVSDMDVRLGKSEVMLRSFDGIHECVCSAYMFDTFFPAN